MAIVADTFHAEDAGTNTVVTISEFIHKTSGTPAAGLGASIGIGAENSAGTAKYGCEIQGYLSTVTASSEVGVCLIKVMSAGALTQALKINTPLSIELGTADGDVSCIIGRTRMDSRATDVAYWSHYDQTTAGSAALAQNASGDTFINCTSGRTVFFRQGGNNRFNLTGTTITIDDTVNFAYNGTTGTKHGTATNQKIGFWNVTPIVQPASANQAALTNSTAGTYDGTLAALADLTDSPASADALRDDIVNNLLPVLRNNFTDIHTLLDAIRTALVNSGLMKGAA